MNQYSNKNNKDDQNSYHDYIENLTVTEKIINSLMFWLFRFLLLGFLSGLTYKSWLWLIKLFRG